MFQDNCYYGLLRFPDLNFCLTTGVTGCQRWITRPRHLISPLVYTEVRVCHALIFVLLFYLDNEIDTVRYFCLFIFDAGKYAYLINKGFTFKNPPFIDAIFACVSLGISSIREHNY